MKLFALMKQLKHKIVTELTKSIETILNDYVRRKEIKEFAERLSLIDIY